MKPETVGCVVNPASGDGTGEARARDLRALFPDATVASTVTEGPEDVAGAARRYRDRDLLVAVGGDGTLREVAAALADVTAPPLFVVPAGRGNSAYRHFYGDADWRAVARELASGLDPWPVDLGRVESEPSVPQRYFVLGVTAGLFRPALAAAEDLRFLPGPLAYLLGAARAALAGDPVRVSVAADGDPLFDGEARLIAVGGGRYRGNAVRLLPDSRPADGRLHLLVVEPAGLRSALAVTRRAREGTHPDHPAVTYAQAETVELHAPDSLPAEVDGTPLSPLREVRLGVEPGGLTLARPE